MAKECLAIGRVGNCIIFVYKVRFLSHRTQWILIARTSERVLSLRKHMLLLVGITEHGNAPCGTNRRYFYVRVVFCGFNE